LSIYSWFQKETDALGYETKWAGAATIIAQQMPLMEDQFIAFMTKDSVINLAKEGNKAIFDDVLIIREIFVMGRC
jgi:hypothetical protein